MEDFVHRVASHTGLHLWITTSRIPPKLSFEQGLLNKDSACFESFMKASQTW